MAKDRFKKLMANVKAKGKAMAKKKAMALAVLCVCVQSASGLHVVIELGGVHG